MAENIAPTRSNLLQRRDQLRLANRGADLLKRKRDALIGEFFGLVKESLAARRALNETSKEAYFSLFLANAWDGPEALQSLSLAEGSQLEVDIKVENLFGVKVPQVQPPKFDDKLPFSPHQRGHAHPGRRRAVSQTYRSAHPGGCHRNPAAPRG